MISKSEIVGQLASNIDVEQLADNNLHIAVMRNPSLNFILDGSKTVESRLSKKKIIPYEVVAEGYYILFKKTEGPVVAISTIEKCWYYQNPDISWCKEKFNSFLINTGSRNEMQNTLVSSYCRKLPRFNQSLFVKETVALGLL